jgi:hypothetical protein
MIRPAGPEVEVELHFGPTQMSVRNLGGRHAFHTLHYSAIAAAEYRESRHARVFVRTTRHWLRLRGAAGWELRLRLDREVVKPVIAAFEQRSGRQVQTLAPEQERDER